MMGYDGSVFPIKALQLKRPKRFDQKNLYKRLRFRTHESLEHLVMMERSIDRSPRFPGVRVWEIAVLLVINKHMKIGEVDDF